MYIVPIGLYIMLFTWLFQDYIIRRLQLESDQIAEDERLIKQYREDTEKKRAQIEELKTTYESAF